MTPTALRLKTRTLSGKRLEVVVPELNEDEEVELIVLRSAPVPAPPRFASAWEFLQSLPRVEHTLEEWAEIERDFRAERDTWDD